MKAPPFSGNSGRRGRTALLLALLIGVVAAGVSAVPNASAHLGLAPAKNSLPTISICANTPNVYIYFTSGHRPPTFSTVSPQPNACWISTEHDLNSAYEHSNFTTCSGTSNPYPDLKREIHGDGSQFSYDDTNTNAVHPSEIGRIANACMQGASHLDVEFEAAGAAACGSSSHPAWVDRNTGFTVGVYLKELYHSPDSCRDSISCPYGSNSTHYGCILNIGADIPHDFGGPCLGTTTSCHAQMTTDIESVCVGGSGTPNNIGIYSGPYTLNGNDNGTDDAAVLAGWINAEINNHCAYLFTG